MTSALAGIERETTTVNACRLLGMSRATTYRHRRPPMHGPAPRPAVRRQPHALDQAERDHILQVLTSARFADKAPAQVWAILLDEGTYLASEATFYRVLRDHDMSGERRNQATHPAKTRPELLACGPDEVWSWDITKLKGPSKGIYYNAYVMLDIFSRKNIHTEIHTQENGDLAKTFIENAIHANGGVIPDAIHSDNGAPMTSKTVAELLGDLHITRSLSRPKVSNDNPYSEAVFKTLKYCPSFPEQFPTIEAARHFLTQFFTYYNTHHRHSGIGYYTPHTVHDGTWTTIRDHRQHTLNTAHQNHPNRFRHGPPQAPRAPAKS
ncbi:MAG: IS3 family transposase [Angustibacter sp.]